jgi:hypothetical protein
MSGLWSIKRTHYHHQKYWKEASQGSVNIGALSALKSSQLIPKLEIHVKIDDVTLQPDPVEEMAVELGLDLLDFCIDQLEDDCVMILSDMEVDENELKVSVKIVVMRESNLPISQDQIAEIDADHTSRNCPDAVTDSKTQAEPAEVEAVHEWLEIDNEDVPRSTDIFAIVKRCLKDVKKLKCGHTVKMMTQLTAVSEYVKLRYCY